jgi:hypothetical protein
MTSSGPSVHRTRPRFVVVDVDVEVEGREGKGWDLGEWKKNGME